MQRHSLGTLIVMLSLAGCAPSSSAGLTNQEGTPDGGLEADGNAASLTDDQYRAQFIATLQASLDRDLAALEQGVSDLAAAAPRPKGRGWDAAQDANALAAMKEAWVRARNAYEHEEGALAPLFPDIDYSIDARYDNFMTDLLSTPGDPYLFDDSGVVGLHAVERILYSDQIPAQVVAFESTLPGYHAAAYPKTENEAADFKDKLCTKLVADIQLLRAQLSPATLQGSIAFQGLISLMTEQREKVSKAASTEEESRYAQRTMADVRKNLEGTRAAYTLLQPWLRSKKMSDPLRDGATIDERIMAGFAGLENVYSGVSGDAVPQPPATWSSLNPTPADLATPFGVLYTSVTKAVDPNREDSVVSAMNAAGRALGLLPK
jgi:iron uptake system component EfeO